MPLYAWKGLDAKGKPARGTRDADGAKALRLLLRKEGVFVSELREARPGEAGAARNAGGGKQGGLGREVDFGRFFERVSVQEINGFTRQLGTLLRAGIPLAEGLGAMVEQSDNKKLEMILAGVRQKVNEGGSLADALGAHPEIFPELYVNMVRSGEAAGNLDSVLTRLADFLDSQHELRQKVVGALVYPIVMMVIGTGIMGLLMVVVVPKITSVFDDLGKTLPWNTQLLIFVAALAGKFWWGLLILGGLAAWGVRRWMRTASGRARVDRVWLRLPVVGPVVRYVAVARFSRTLSTMLASGVEVLNALQITKRVLSNVILEKVVDEARDAIREGESIAAPLKRSRQFPPMFCHMVTVGERSGQLESMLESAAVAFEHDVDTKVQRLTALLSPLMIVSMAVAVGFIVWSVLEPIMDMQQFAQ